MIKKYASNAYIPDENNNIFRWNENELQMYCLEVYLQQKSYLMCSWFACSWNVSHTYIFTALSIKVVMCNRVVQCQIYTNINILIQSLNRINFMIYPFLNSISNIALNLIITINFNLSILQRNFHDVKKYDLLPGSYKRLYETPHFNSLRQVLDDDGLNE